ncbi:MAG: hypothetical protein VB108_07145 [Anaerolineaceae bacterium]|nr:hypothetical protein [Anaerolineaceae bacterium]
MKKICLAFLSILFIVSACGIINTAENDKYQATLVSMEVQMKLMEQNMAATAQALSAEQKAPTQACPTLAPCPTCAPATIIVTPTQGAAATVPPKPYATSGPTGGVAGSLNYPSSQIPAQRVVAFNIKTGYYYWQNTNAGTGNYSFEKLPPGTYHLMSYLISDPKNLMAGYSQAVPCGLNASCTDHNLIDVEVKAGEETQGINIFDWYADPVAAGWPADPTQK